MKIKIVQVVKASIALGLIVFVIVDFVLDRKFTNQSSDLTLSLQQWGGRPLETIGELLSTAFTFWIFGYFILYVVLNQDHEYMVFTLASYFLPLIVVLVLKALYYRGRPYAISEDISGCECDPGMPSGHACMAIMAYSILYDQCKRLIINSIHKKTQRRLVSVVIGVFCAVMAALVAFSRITLGVHSYPQILIGGAIAVLSSLLFTFEIFKKIMLKLLPYRRIAACIFGGCISLFSVVMLFINHYAREKPEYWKFFDKCPKCKNSFVKGQCESLSLTLFPACYVLSIMIVDPIVEKIVAPRTDNPEVRIVSGSQEGEKVAVPNAPYSTPHLQIRTPESGIIQTPDIIASRHAEIKQEVKESQAYYTNNQNREKILTRGNLLRLLILIGLCIPSFCLILLFELAIKPAVDSLIVQSLLIFFLYGIGAGWLGASTSGIKNMAYRKYKLLTRHDLISKERLSAKTYISPEEKEDMIDIHMPQFHHNEGKPAQDIEKACPHTVDPSSDTNPRNEVVIKVSV